MVVRVSYCRWYVSCERGPHPLSRIGAYYIYTCVYFYLLHSNVFDISYEVLLNDILLKVLSDEL